MGTGSLPGVKRPGYGVDHPPSSIVEDEKSRALSHLPLWTSMALLNTALEGGE